MKASKADLTRPESEDLEERDWNKPHVSLPVSKGQFEGLEMGDTVTIEVTGKITELSLNNEIGRLEAEIDESSIYGSDHDSEEDESEESNEFADLAEDD